MKQILHVGFFQRSWRLLLAGIGLVMLPQFVWAQISIPTLNTAVTENFNTLATSGSTNALSTFPASWTFLETGTGANTTYAADAGSGTTANTYSYGTGTNADRAIGSIQSNALGMAYGASFTNNTGSTINTLQIAYTGEMWRLGTTGRVDRLDFAYSIDATSLNSGTYTDVDNLDFASPVTTGTVGALVGNNSPNKTAITYTITGLSITSGTTFWIKWTDFNASGNDDGLAVDDFSITAGVTAPANTITTGTITGSPFCAGSTISVPYTTTGTFTGTYTAQLSAVDGTFTTPIATATGATPINLAIPTGTATGTGYKVRVINSTPATTGSESAAFTINAKAASNATTVAPLGDQTFDLALSGTQLTASPALTSTYAWKYGAVQGGPYGNTVSGATAATYTPAGSDFGAGTYYLVAEATTTGNCPTTGVSNEFKITVTSSTPLITITQNLQIFNAAAGGQSAEQSYTVTGSALTANLEISAPAYFFISENSGGPYTATLSLTPASGSVSKTIYVVYAPETAGNHPFVFVHSSTGANTPQFTATGNSVPTLNTTGSFTAVTNQAINTSSTGQLFTLTGTNLAGTVLITAPASFEVSKTSATTGFSGSVSFAPVSGTASGSFWVRYSPTAAGSHSGSVTIASATDGISATPIAVSGTALAIPDAPVANAASANSTTGFTANWTAPAGTVTSYRLDVATDIAFTAMVSGYSNLTVSGTSQLITGLTAYTAYYYRVRAVNAAGTSGNSTVITTNTSAATATIFNRADVSGYPTWTDANVLGSTYLQLVAGSSTVTPAINLNDYTGESLTFKTRTFGTVSGSGATSTALIKISISIDNAAFVEIGTKTPTSNSTALAGNAATFDLSSYSGSARIKFETPNGSGTTIGAGIDDIILTGTQTASVTTTNVTASPYCANTTVNVPFTTSGTFISGNTFTAQLSDASGSFAAPIATATGTSPSISITIPSNAITASAYKVRVVASLPATTGSESSAFAINAIPATNVATVSPNSAVTVRKYETDATLTATVTNTSTYAWYYSRANDGTGLTAITSATASSYTVAGNDFGTITDLGVFYIYVKTTSACGSVTGTSVPVQVTVNAAQPLITIPATTFTTFNAPVNGQSAAQSFTVSASALSANLIITAPAGFKVSRSSGSGYADSLQFAPNGSGIITSKIIYVIYKPTTLSNPTVDITLTSTGATSKTVTLTGDSNPALTSSVASLNFTTLAGTQSAEQSYTITAKNLTANLEISASGRFKFSQTSGGTKVAGPVYISPATDGTINTTIYVVYEPGTPPGGLHSGSILNASLGATDVSVTLNGNSEPVLTPSATSVTFADQIITSYSAGQPITLTGTLLTGDVTITAPTNFEVSSTSADAGFGSTITLTPASGSLTSTFWIRFLPLTVNSYSDNVSVIAAADGLAFDIAVTGNGIDVPAETAGLLLLEDNFNGTSGTDLAGWNVINSGNALKYSTSGANYNNYGSSAIGKGVSIAASGLDYNKTFTQQTTSGVIYASVVVNANTTSTGDYFLHFGELTGTALNPAILRGRVFIRDAGNGFINFGVSNAGTAAAAVWSGNYAQNTAHLVVVRYEFTATTQSTELYVNPNTFSKPAATITATDNTSGLIPLNIGAVAIRQGSGGPTLTLDGLRVGTGWGAVLGNPNFSGVATLMPGNYNNIRIDAGAGNAVSLTDNVSVTGRLTLLSGKVVVPTGKTLTIETPLAYNGDPGYIVGGSSTSFVEGALAQKVAYSGETELKFPIAKANNYRPVGLYVTHGSNTSTTYTATQFEGKHTPLKMPETPVEIEKVSAIRYFRVSRSSGGAPLSEAVITLAYGADDMVTDSSNLAIVKTDAASPLEWKYVGGTAYGKNSGYIISDPFFSFSDFILANKMGGLNPLPVELVAFNAKLADKKVRLNWVTASEKNNAYFVVERSRDGREFTEVSKVTGAGSASVENRYNAVDANPYVGISYYRLKQVDMDGAFVYSKTVSVTTLEAGKSVSLYPNPATDLLNLDLGVASAQVNVKVVNMLGQVVLTKTITNTAEAQLNVSGLPNGTYQVITETDQTKTVNRFVKISR